MLRLHYRHCFDPRGLSREERQSLARESKMCFDTLSRLGRRHARRA